MGAQFAGTGAGIAGGTALAGPVGGILGGAGGNVAAGQAFDAVADWLMGTQERPRLASVETAVDAALGAAGPAAAAVARPALRFISGVSRQAAERVSARIAQARNDAIERGMNRPDIVARIKDIDEAAAQAADDAFEAATASGANMAAAEAAATQAGREAASAAARRVWAEAEAAGRVPPKTGGARRTNPEVTAEARLASERARDEARARALAAARPVDPETAARTAAERVRAERLAPIQAELAAGASQAAGRAAATSAARTVGRGTERLGDLTAVVSGVASGNPVTAALIFGTGRAVSAAQRTIAQRLLQREGFRSFVQETRPAFGTRQQILASLTAIATNKAIDAATRSDARALRLSIMSTGLPRAPDGRFLPDPDPESPGPDGRDLEDEQ